MSVDNFGSELFSFEKSNNLMNYWKSNAYKMSEISKSKQYTYTVLHYVIMIPIIVVSTANPILTGIIGDEFVEFNAIASLFVAVLGAVSAFVKADGKRVKYQNNYTNCKLFIERVEFSQSLELDQVKLKEVIEKMTEEYKKLVVELPTFSNV